MNILSKTLIIAFIVISIGCQGSFESGELLSDDLGQISVKTINLDKEHKPGQSTTSSDVNDSQETIQNVEIEHTVSAIVVNESKKTIHVEPSQEDKGNIIGAQGHVDYLNTDGIVKVIGGDSEGTGFFVSPHTLVTNFYFINSIRKLQGSISKHLFIVHPETNAHVPVHSIQVVDAENDLAVLYIKYYESPVYYELFEESEETLSSLEGYLFDRRRKSLPILEGFLSSFYASQTMKSFSLVFSLGLSGLSGSPVFSIDGKVVGVLTLEMARSQTPEASLSSPKAVRELLLSTFINCQSVKCMNEEMLRPQSDRVQEYELIDAQIAKTMYLAEQGSMSAQSNLGWMYLNGKGLKKDDEEATKWTRKAAEQGHAWAQYRLGWMYLNGKGVPKDDGKAIKWLRKAANQGHITAQYRLGKMYLNGQGVGQDYEEAAKWYERAAEQGYAQAQYGLGWIYANGKGVEKDDEKAMRWYALAAEQGHTKAQRAL